MNCINKILFIPIFLLLSGNIIAQLPEFTPVDTGGIYNLGQSLVHVSAIVADIDNDGDLDPVISNIGVPTVNKPPLTLYKNERNGFFQRRTLLQEYKNAFLVKVTSPFGDIDNDGDIDMIGQFYENPSLGVFTNDGYGNFSSVTELSLPFNLGSSLYPVLFDYNKDGYLDLVQFDTRVTILPNNGEGQFLEPEYFSYSEEIPNDIFFHGMSWGDVDNDGDMDYYLGTTSPKSYTKNVFIINTDSGLHKMDDTHITLSDTAYTPCVNWIDYDNDGDLDLFVDNMTNDTVNGSFRSLYENLGNLEFEKHIFDDRNFRGSHSNSSVWGDIDNDGDLDLFISIENNPFPWGGQVSKYPYNILYLNNGDGQFSNIFDHALTTTDSHTAKLFDHDNDGDLDVLMIRYSWDVDGHNQLYINEGNNNTSITLNCIDRNGCATPFGTRIYAKTKINEKDVSQMREIIPVNGHLSYGNTRVHFGFGDAETVDSLIIRWPSGHIDTYQDIPVGQFYRATEEDSLEIDFKASNYIQLKKSFEEVNFATIYDSISFELSDYFNLVIRDTIPLIIGDTLTYTVHSNLNPDIVSVSIDPETNVLTLEAGADDPFSGYSTIQIKTSAGFTSRLDHLNVRYLSSSIDPRLSDHSVWFYPNPANDLINIETEHSDHYSINITSLNGQLIYSEEMEGTTHQIDLSSFQKGVYFITIRSEDIVTTRKIVKL